jgi:hypothetical protein
MWVAHTLQISCLVLKGLATKDQHFLSYNFCPCDVGKINYSWLPECKNSDDNTTSNLVLLLMNSLPSSLDPRHNTTIIYFLIGKLDFPSYTISYWKFSFVIILMFIVNLWSKTNSPSFAANFHLKIFWMWIFKMRRLNMDCCKVKKVIKFANKEYPNRSILLGTEWIIVHLIIWR